GRWRRRRTVVADRTRILADGDGGERRDVDVLGQLARAEEVLSLENDLGSGTRRRDGDQRRGRGGIAGRRIGDVGAPGLAGRRRAQHPLTEELDAQLVRGSLEQRDRRDRL